MPLGIPFRCDNLRNKLHALADFHNVVVMMWRKVIVVTAVLRFYQLMMKLIFKQLIFKT